MSSSTMSCSTMSCSTMSSSTMSSSTRTWAPRLPSLHPPLHSRCTRILSHLEDTHPPPHTHRAQVHTPPPRGPIHVGGGASPLSPLLFLVRSMWSFSWMRTCRSLGSSLMNGCFSSCSVLGRWLWLFTRQPSMKDWNFFDLHTHTHNTHTHGHTHTDTHTHATNTQKQEHILN